MLEVEALPDEQPIEVPTLTSPVELPQYIDSSMLTTYRACKRKYEYTYGRGIAPLGHSIHLAAGSAVAAGCEAARNYQFHPSRRSSPAHIDDLLHAAIGPFIRAWEGYQSGEDETKNQHNTFHALEGYLTQYHPFHDQVQPHFRPDGSPSTEFTFAIPLPINHPTTGEPFLFVGRFDMLGDYQGVTVVVDEKTTSALGPYWLRQWDLRGQFLGYCWACQQLGHKVDHTVVRGIAIQKTQHQFAQVLVQYPQHLIDRWYMELLHSIQGIIYYFEQGYWPYNFGDACASYGGCTYAELCKAHDPEAWLTNYQIRRWSPVSLTEGP